MDARSKVVFFQLCRAALRNFVPAGEIADGMFFGAKEAIAQHELGRLMEQMSRQLKVLVERLDHLEEQSDKSAQERMIEKCVPRLLQKHKTQFGEVFHKLGKIHESYDVKVREFGERFQGGEASEFLEETGLGVQFPHLSEEILRHLSGEGVMADIYHLHQELDRGGMSQIFRAQRKDNGEWRALKRFTPAGRGMLERFLIEGYVGKYFLDSEYLVSTFDFGGFLNSGDYFIECELLHGENLSRWLQSNPYRGPEDPHLRLVGQMLEGLRYLHGEGFIHRDVKPANFFLTEDGFVKMLDFGIIKSLRHQMADIGLTHTNQSLGTSAYKAPEQIDPIHFGPVSEKTDIYSLGVTMFELLTGKPPFLGTRMEVERQHLQKAPRRPSQSNIALTAEMDDLVLACLTKDPSKRPSLDEVVAMLPPPPALDERTGLLELLCWEGLYHREEMVAQLQDITEKETENLGIIQAYVEKGRIHKFRERVLAQIHHRVGASRKLLWKVRQELSTWDPLRFSERCPNLLCGQERTRGSRSCSGCGVDFTAMICQSCKKETSYFSERCQRGLCGEIVTKEQKMRFIVETTSQYALARSEGDAAQGFLILSLLLSGQMQWTSDSVSIDWMELLRLRFAQANRIFQSEQVEEFRNALRKLVRQAREQYCREQKIHSKEILKEVSWLIDEGRALDAHQELQKIPRLIWDDELQALEDRINESLTYDELEEAQSLIVQTKPKEALEILTMLPYDSKRRQELLDRTHKLQRALMPTAPRAKQQPTTLPMTSAIALHHRVLPRTASVALLASFLLTSGLAYFYFWSTPSHPKVIEAFIPVMMVNHTRPSSKRKTVAAPPFVLPRDPQYSPPTRMLSPAPRRKENHIKTPHLSLVKPNPTKLLRRKITRQTRRAKGLIKLYRALKKRAKRRFKHLRKRRRRRRCKKGRIYVCKRRCLRKNRKGRCIRKNRRWKCSCQKRR